MTDRAIIYTRVSTPGQDDGTSPETQERDCRAYASAHGYEVVGVLHDTVTAATLDRPMMRELRALLLTGTVDVLLARTVDRLVRDQTDMHILWDDVRKGEARLESVREPFEDTTLGKFIATSYAFLAELERHKILDRTRGGRISRAAEGKYIASRAPFGYVRAGRHAIEPDPDQAAVVQLMFDLYELNVGLRRIAVELNTRGHRTRFGRLWAVKQVRDVLGNEAVCGVLRYGPVRIEDAFPAIISRAQFDRVQRRIERKAGLPRGRTHVSPNLLIGVLFCGVCHGRMVGAPSNRPATSAHPDGDRVRAYECRRHRAGQGCEANWHRADDLEARVIADLNASTGGIGRAQQIAAQFLDRLRSDVTDLEAALRRHDARRRALAEAITDRVFSGDQARQASADLEADRVAIDAALAAKRAEVERAEADVARLAAQPADVRRLLDEGLPPQQAKAIIQTYTRRIEVHPGDPEPYILE